jgi:hypothetical protein
MMPWKLKLQSCNPVDKKNISQYKENPNQNFITDIQAGVTSCLAVSNPKYGMVSKKALLELY